MRKILLKMRSWLSIENFNSLLNLFIIGGTVMNFSSITKIHNRIENQGICQLGSLLSLKTPLEMSIELRL